MKRFILVCLCLLIFLPSSAARRVRWFSDSSLYGIPKDKLFPVLVSEIITKHAENEKKGLPTVVGWAGYTGAGQSITAKQFARYLEKQGLDVTILGCDDYIIPKPQRVRWAKVRFPEPGREIRADELKLRIRGVDENTIELKIPSSDWVRVRLDKVGEKVKVYDEDTGKFLDFELGRQPSNNIIIHVPTFISKLDALFYKDIMDLKKGKTILIPQFDQVTREKLRLTKEEIDQYSKKVETIQIYGKDYLVIDKKRRIVADVRTGYIYRELEPEGIIIVEGVWTMLRPEVNEVYDLKVFITASEERRLRRFGRRHILENRYKGQMLFGIVERGQIDWWEEQAPYEKRQAAVADYILSNDEPLSEMEMTTRFGTEEERIYKAIATYREDIKKSRGEEEIVPWELLEYAWYVLTDGSALSNALEHIIEGLKDGGYTEIGLRRMLGSQEGAFGELDDLQKSLLEDLLIEAKLLERREVKFTASWMKREFLQMFREALPMELIPQHLLLMGKRYPVLENWGFKEFTDNGQVTSIEEINKAAGFFVTALYNLYAMETLQRYLDIPSHPAILSLGSGEFLKEIFMSFYFKPSILYGVDSDVEIIEEARQNIKDWEIDKGRQVKVIHGDMTQLEGIDILKGKKFDLIIMRIPVGMEMEDFRKTVESVKRFLSEDGYLIFYMRHPQLRLTFPQKLIGIMQEENIFSFNVYPLSGTISPDEKDKFVILSRGEIEELIEKLRQF